MFIFLLALAMASAAGLLGWRTLINNFAVEAAGMDGLQMGVVQGVREIPGFLSLLVIYTLLFIKEVRMAALSIMIFGLGIAVTGLIPSFTGILTMTLIMSFGFHFYAALAQSLTLQYFDEVEAPLVLGKIRGYSAGASVAMAAVLLVLAKLLSFPLLFALVGLMAVAAGSWAFTQNPIDKELIPQHNRMIFRARYWLFYALTFLSGARRQIFVAFAVFLLVEKFHYTVSGISLLFIITNIFAYFTSPMIGKAIARFGERKVLSLEYMSLFIIFGVYAFTDSKIIVGLMYILDNIFFNFSIGINTYFQKIGDPQDIGATMAVGFTINHIAAVALPVVGGALWLIDYKITFVGGMALALVSLVLVQFINYNRQARS